MNDPRSRSDPEEQALVRRIIRGDTEALAALFARHRPRLYRMIQFRLDPKLAARLDPDDILQEAWLRAVDRIGSFVTDARGSPFVWLRMIVVQTLIDLHRRHLGAQRRSAQREQSRLGGFGGDSTSLSLTRHLIGQLTSPSAAAMRAELSQQLDAALATMSDIDREVLALRHFEELTNQETALVLGMSEQAASARYVRALARLKKILESIPGFMPLQES